jgi:hypothetical protein
MLLSSKRRGGVGGMSKFSRGIVGLSMLVSGLVGATGRATAGPVPGDGGQVSLESPIRVLDTRFSHPQTGVTTTTLGPGRILNVSLQARQTAGTARLHPCGAPPSTGQLAFVYRPNDALLHRVLTDASSDCLTATSAVDFVIDKYGDIATAATTDRLQYVPLPAPLTLVDGNASFGSTTPLSLGTTPPDGQAAVLAVQTYGGRSPGYATAFTCGFQPNTADNFIETWTTANVAYVPVTAAAGPCVFMSSAAHLRVTLLGWLSKSGPDTTSLPPAIKVELQSVRAPGLVAITPLRVLDTRTVVPFGKKLDGGEVIELPFGPESAASVSAVVLNVTVDSPQAGGFVTVYPCDQPQPVASNLNFSSGQTIANAVTVKLPRSGSVCIYSSSTTHVIADFMGGYLFGRGSGSQAVAPLRLLDTRNALGVTAKSKVGADSTMALHVAGTGGVPALGAQAVTLNVTVDQPEAGGFVTVYPCGENVPTSSNLNYVTGQTIANLVTVKLGLDGDVCFFTSGATHLIADLAAWYQPSLPAGFEELEPIRVLDSRNAIGVAGKTLLAAGSISTLGVAGRGGVPADGADAVTLNVTVDQPQGGGFVTVFPCGQQVPTASNLNYASGQTIANLVNVKLAANGTVCIFTSASAHVLADVAGYSTTVQETSWSSDLTHLRDIASAALQPDAAQLLNSAVAAARRFRVG